MRKMLNTLYVTSEDAYLTLCGETVDVVFGDDTHKAIPLHTLEHIVCFSYKGASPALMGKCAECGITLTFFSPNGRYLADIGNSTTGNVLLRRTQYRVADDNNAAILLAKSFITGKLYNTKYLLLHYARDHALQMDESKVRTAADRINGYMHDIEYVTDTESLRGIEGNAAAEYFGVFQDLILHNKDVFQFHGRSRRPPLDNINAMLSFAYTLLASDCVGALRSVGLDPYVGFMHTDKPGRKSLALDIMEELRTVFADRFVLTLVNNRMFNGDDFITLDSGAVVFSESAKKRFLAEWQKKKYEEIKHPYLGEKMPWGLVPYVQSLLLARFLRGDLDGYPPFFWK